MHDIEPLELTITKLVDLHRQDRPAQVLMGHMICTLCPMHRIMWEAACDKAGVQ